MKKAPISVRIFYYLTQIVFWLLILVTAAVFVLNILTETRVIGDEFQLRVQLPITFDVNETGSVNLYGSSNEIRIEEATGQMHVVDTPLRFSKIVLRFLFVVVLLVLFMTWKFKRFITNIKHGEIFTIENINNLKHLAYGLLALWLVMRVYLALMYYLMVDRLDFSTISMNYELIDDSSLLIGALLLWVLAHVFMKGVEMKEEQELTI